jgi:energy-coupling factor transport system permease protein
VKKEKFLEKLDPRSKLVMVFCFSGLAVFFNDAEILFAVFLCLLVLLLAGGKPNPAYKRVAAGLVTLSLPLFIIQCLFVRGGEAVLTAGNTVLLTHDGLNSALSVALRLLVVSLSAMLLYSEETRDYLLALVQWKVPYEIAFMVMIGIHFIPLIGEEGRNLIFSVQMRGTELKKISTEGKIKAYSQLLLPILAGALQRAKMMSLAMETRAFRAYPKRTYLRQLKLKRRDKLVISCSLFLSFALIWRQALVNCLMQ